MTATISLFRSATDNLPIFEPIESVEALFLAMDGHSVRSEKDGPLWSPAEFAERCPCESCGGRRPHRRNDQVVQIHFGVLDFDDLSEEIRDRVRSYLRDFEHIWHTSWSHTEEAGRYRAIVALSRPVQVEEWSAFWCRFVARFGAVSDESCSDPARIYYLPSCPPETEALAEFLYTPGETLDVDDVLLDPLPAFAIPRARPQAAPPAIETYQPTPWAVEWALEKLEELAEEVERIDDATAPMHPTLNKAAFTVGGMIPHLLDEEEAAMRLLEAALLRNPDRMEKYIPIIERGIQSGREKPIIPEPRYSWTDTGNAERIRDMFGGKLHYVPNWRAWLVWGGSSWSIEETIQPQVKEAIQRIREEAAQIPREDVREGAMKWAARSEGADRRRAAEFLTQSETGIKIDHELIDSDHMVLGCANGLVELKTGRLRPVTPADLITKNTMIPYHPDAECPRWERFLDEIMDGDTELIGYLRRAVGYSLTGRTDEQKLFFLHGSGANGKSTFINAILNILGSYAGPGAPELLMQRRSGAHPTEQADLVGKRMVSCQEVEEGRYWNEPLLKQLTGDDPIKARRMREDFWSFWPTHKLWVSGNHKPNVRGTDDGIWRRLILIPFEKSFKDKPDPNLKADIRKELPGILAWAVRGCLEWQERGLDEPEVITRAVETYRSEQDLIAQFLKDRCEIGLDHECSRRQLRATYELWCEEEGDRRPFSPRAFNNALRDRGFWEIRLGETSERGWRGLRVKQSAMAVLHMLTPAKVGAK